MGAYIRDDDFAATMEQVFALFPILRRSAASPRASSRAASASRWRWAAR